MRFDNKVALVTGAAAGLGRAYAIMLAERGAKVVLVDQLLSCKESVLINGEQAAQTNQALIQTYDSIIKLGGDCIYFMLDVSHRDEVNRMVEEVILRWRRIDILINNAGVYGACPFEHIKLEQWQRQLDVDLNGCFYLTQAVWPYMQQQNFGRVMMTTGTSALFGDLHQVGFSASKMALVGMVNCLSLEGDAYNIHVNSLCPHAVTAMTEHHLASVIQPLFSFESLTATTAFLVSEQAPNGQHLLAGAGSVSHGMFVEFEPMYFNEDLLTPNNLLQHWRQLYRSFPVTLHPCGEDKVLSWSILSALEHHIKID
ncbi:SDR family NAD(P)-dependent oxidoreductase [Shewanella glacialipiscicola]|uniref:SDR family NAD(P)-dependent oxidoreductase n=1 Tax=Shewanella glacialipiscicola TaxID=614069 RepID=UPI0021D9BF5B|nr:SDR family NAD(P)-dependent oxidoreductase [Shewanella glacialipiscicola]MCU7994666.1 SDR family NAD(P)-dependent oxidoreductase [Shewanella glacialipiscicola]MCU8026137.1 SDR family NAD(P)-dependent oxidoreductase [Shewanella glacialipiscicola]